MASRARYPAGPSSRAPCAGRLNLDVGGSRMFPGVHDSEVVAYSVDSRAGELVLMHAPGTGSAASGFRLLFRGLLAHRFPYPQLPSVVLDLAEVPVAALLEREWASLAEGYRQCGWPGPWAETLGSAIAHCENTQVKAYELEQSYGMSGWILARSVERSGAP